MNLHMLYGLSEVEVFLKDTHFDRCRAVFSPLQSAKLFQWEDMNMSRCC